MGSSGARGCRIPGKLPKHRLVLGRLGYTFSVKPWFGIPTTPLVPSDCLQYPTMSVDGYASSTTDFVLPPLQPVRYHCQRRPYAPRMHMARSTPRSRTQTGIDVDFELQAPSAQLCNFEDLFPLGISLYWSNALVKMSISKD